ncbi:hypothetical protein DFJ74DRAFT_108765 [Hyaloraphidium curvatum]|nr:hypothetical protein DFJ74DRAFT_108765 [Hyaloraphidium curvatum]
MMALLTRKNSSDERRATVFKALTVVCVTLPQVVADATILQPIVEAMENVLAYGGIESASAALRFANGAFGLARSESQLVSATGRRLIRRLGPLLFDFALARANRVHTEPLADAATVPVELLLQVLASAAACLPADGERSAFLAANVDLLARLLAPTSSTDEERYEPRHISSQSKQLQRTVSQALMQLAVSDPAGFRGVVGMVDVATKNRLQAALEAGQQRKAPSIALKSFA